MVAQYGNNTGGQCIEGLRARKNNRTVGAAVDIDAKRVHVYLSQFSHRRHPLAVRQAQRTIKADDFAVQHLVTKDTHDEIRIFVRRAEP